MKKRSAGLGVAWQGTAWRASAGCGVAGHGKAWARYFKDGLNGTGEGVKLNTRIQRALTKTTDSWEVAKSIRPSLTESEIMQLLANEVTRVQRSEVRAIENGVQLKSLVGDRPLPKLPDLGKASDVLLAWRPLLDQPLKLGDGTKGITFRTATLTQWRANRAMFEKKRAGLDAHIEICLAAERTIEAAGVSCLGDLEATAAAA